MIVRSATSQASEVRTERLRERVYVAFTALAVVITLRTHREDAETTALTFVIVVCGTLLAGLVSQLMAHVVVHAALPPRDELRRSVEVTGGAFTSLLLPLVFVGLAAVGVWPVDRALRAATIALVAALVAIGYLAARRVRLPAWQRLLVMLAEVAVGGLVLLLELLAHG